MLETLKKFKLEAKNIQSFNVKIQRSKDRLILENELLKTFDFLTENYDNCPIYIYKKYFYNGWDKLQVCPVCGKPLGIRIHKKEIKILQTCGNINCSNIHRKTTNLDKYGTECVIQNEQVKEKTKHTNILRYGTEIPQQSDVVKNKTIATNRKKYGFDSHHQNSDIKRKKIVTNLKKYGCEYPIQNQTINDKLKQTNLERYGYECALQNGEIRDKIKQTNLNRYGYECALQSKEIKEKIKNTNLNRYGQEHPLQNQEIKDKLKHTNLVRYGYENVSQNDEIKQKKIEKSLLNYGCKFPFQNQEIKDKIKQTNLIRYGCENVSQNDDIKKRKINKSLLNCGYEYPSQNQVIKDKSKQTNLFRYGCENVSQSTNIKLKISNSLKIHHSKKSNEMYENLGYSIIQSGNKLFKLKCPKCGGEFFDFHSFFRQRKYLGFELCTHCNPRGHNQTEYNLSEFINLFAVEIRTSDREILRGKEIDIYIPSLNIGFEFNGLYWYSDKFKSKLYHQEKKYQAIEQGVNLIHIWEDDWNYKREIIEARIKNVLGVTENKIFARKCSIVEVTASDSKAFLEQNHIQGQVGAKRRLGLIYDGNLVSLMTFGMRNNKMEMLRFCNKLEYNVVGGFSRLLKHFRKEFTGEIYSYADLDWSNPNDNVYISNGFTFVKKTEPGYFWSKNKCRFSRQQFQKHKLIKQGFDASKTEDQIMIERGYLKIYNSGNLLYVI